jgi:hypothetical protein
MFYALSPKEFSAFPDVLEKAPTYKDAVSVHFASRNRKEWTKDWFDNKVSKMMDSERMVLYANSPGYKKPNLD